MKRFIFVCILTGMLLLCACGNQVVDEGSKSEQETVSVMGTMEEDISAGTETKENGVKIPMVMVDGQMYYATGKESTIEARCGVMDGEITSSVDVSETPMENNQSNFGSGYGYQYGIEGTIEVQMEDGNWYVYEAGSGEGKIRFGNSDKWYDKEYLSEETIEWLYWYNSLPEDEQLAINSVPKELIDAEEYVDTQTEEAKGSIRVENPSWDYYTAEKVVSGTKPYTLQPVEEKENEITDTDAWFARNDLSLNDEGADEEYQCVIEGNGTLVNVFKGGSCIAGLDFSDYMYAPDLVEADKEFVDETVHDAKIADGILYVSIFHYTYAASAPSNAYIVAISPEDYHVIWKSQPLVCNSLNFEIVDDIIFCGYGFTAEADYLYQLDRITGCVLDKSELKSKPDYIIYTDNRLYVRTYNTDYVFEVIK